MYQFPFQLTTITKPVFKPTSSKAVSAHPIAKMCAKLSLLPVFARRNQEFWFCPTI